MKQPILQQLLKTPTGQATAAPVARVLAPQGVFQELLKELPRPQTEPSPRVLPSAFKRSFQKIPNELSSIITQSSTVKRAPSLATNSGDNVHPRVTEKKDAAIVQTNQASIVVSQVADAKQPIAQVTSAAPKVEATPAATRSATPPQMRVSFATIAKTAHSDSKPLPQPLPYSAMLPAAKAEIPKAAFTAEKAPSQSGLTNRPSSGAVSREPLNTMKSPLSNNNIVGEAKNNRVAAKEPEYSARPRPNDQTEHLKPMVGANATAHTKPIQTKTSIAQPLEKTLFGGDDQPRQTIPVSKPVIHATSATEPISVSQPARTWSPSERVQPIAAKGRQDQQPSGIVNASPVKTAAVNVQAPMSSASAIASTQAKPSQPPQSLAQNKIVPQIVPVQAPAAEAVPDTGNRATQTSRVTVADRATYPVTSPSAINNQTESVKPALQTYPKPIATSNDIVNDPRSSQKTEPLNNPPATKTIDRNHRKPTLSNVSIVRPESGAHKGAVRVIAVDKSSTPFEPIAAKPQISTPSGELWTRMASTVSAPTLKPLNSGVAGRADNLNQTLSSFFATPRAYVGPSFARPIYPVFPSQLTTPGKITMLSQRCQSMSSTPAATISQAFNPTGKESGSPIAIGASTGREATTQPIETIPKTIESRAPLATPLQAKHAEPVVILKKESPAQPPTTVSKISVNRAPSATESQPKSTANIVSPRKDAPAQPIPFVVKGNGTPQAQVIASQMKEATPPTVTQKEASVQHSVTGSHNRGSGQPSMAEPEAKDETRSAVPRRETSAQSAPRVAQDNGIQQPSIIERQARIINDSANPQKETSSQPVSNVAEESGIRQLSGIAPPARTVWGIPVAAKNSPLPHQVAAHAETKTATADIKSASTVLPKQTEKLPRRQESLAPVKAASSNTVRDSHSLRPENTQEPGDKNRSLENTVKESALRLSQTSETISAVPREPIAIKPNTEPRVRESEKPSAQNISTAKNEEKVLANEKPLLTPSTTTPNREDNAIPKASAFANAYSPVMDTKEPGTEIKVQTKEPDKHLQTSHEPAGANHSEADSQVAAAPAANNATRLNDALATPTLGLRAKLTAEQIHELQAMVAKALQASRSSMDGSRETTFQWREPDMGAIHFRVSTVGDDVRVDIQSSRAEVAEALQDSRITVERAFADLGLRMERFDIRHEPTANFVDLANHQAHDQADRQRAEQTRQNSHISHGDSISEAIEEAPKGRASLAEHEWVA